MSVLRGRPPDDTSGIKDSSRALLIPQIARITLALPPILSDGVPPSTSLFAITVSPVAVNHAIRRRATRFWVRL